jgi:hypothetical protein
MSDKTLARIEKSLAKLAETQEALCAEVAALREQVTGKTEGARREEVLRFLDQFRAGEALGEASLGAWIAVSDLECVKGGLRVVQQREGFHARLLAERIKELGGSPSYEIPDAVYAATMKDAGNADKPDAQKVLEFVKRFPDPDAALRPIHALADRLDDDPETQSLLRTIAQDECSTLTFFADACRQLNG